MENKPEISMRIAELDRKANGMAEAAEKALGNVKAAADIAAERIFRMCEDANMPAHNGVEIVTQRDNLKLISDVAGRMTHNSDPFMREVGFSLLLAVEAKATQIDSAQRVAYPFPNIEEAKQRFSAKELEKADAEMSEIANAKGGVILDKIKVLFGNFQIDTDNAFPIRREEIIRTGALAVNESRQGMESQQEASLNA